MAARFVYWMNVSLDLRIERDLNEAGGGNWMRITEQLHREFNERARALSVLVQGRVIYETMEGFWPAARQDESMPDFLREYGEIWTSAPKVLVSRTRTAADYNTRVFGNSGDAMAELATLKQQTDGDIGVGGATLATGLLRAGLLDELVLYVHPALLGTGRSLFDGDAGRDLDLDLLEHATFDEGVVMHRYAIRTPAAAPI